MDDIKLCEGVIKMLQSTDVRQLMYPPAATQPSTIYKDPCRHEPFVCNRITFCFNALLRRADGVTFLDHINVVAAAC